MKINLIKYSSEDKTVVVITSMTPTAIRVTDTSGYEFSVNSFDRAPSDAGDVIVFKMIPSNLTPVIPSYFTMNGIGRVVVHNTSGFDSAAIYDDSDFAATKIDMLNSISESGDEKYYKYVVRFTFLETALNDLSKSGADYETVNKFYSEMVKLVKLFKTKYYFNSKAY